MSENEMRGRLVGRHAAAYCFAGNATFTVARGGERFTFRVTESEDKKIYFVKVLTRPEHYDYMGIVVKSSRSFSVTKATRMRSDAPCMLMFSQMFIAMKAGDSSAFEIWHEGTCGVCGRKLTVPESIESGIGPVCGGRMNSLNN